MATSVAYRVVGIRPDGTIGIQQFSNNEQRAKLIERYVKQMHADWKVLVEVIVGAGKRVKRRNRRGSGE